MIDIEHLQQWIGRGETAEDVLSTIKVVQLVATLDIIPPIASDGGLPRLAHWLFFTPHTSQSELGHDGHPKLGGFLPAVPLPQRMWAGGRLKFLRELALEARVKRETLIKDLVVKHGRQGALVFLTLVHRISDAIGIAIEEEQDIVYRAPFAGLLPAAAKPYDGPESEWRSSLQPDEKLLFRYSALTFNSHRIHYDLPYAQREEGYPALVVQGPLTATLLIDCACKWLGQAPDEFSFRALNPLFAGEIVTLHGRQDDTGLALWAEGHDRRVGMTARASINGQS